MKRSFKLLAVTGVVVGTAFAIKKLLEVDVIQDKFKEKDALDYLKDKYGDEIMDGKKIQIINDDSHADKMMLAEDFIDYELHKED